MNATIYPILSSFSSRYRFPADFFPISEPSIMLIDVSLLQKIADQLISRLSNCEKVRRDGLDKSRGFEEKHADAKKGIEC